MHFDQNTIFIIIAAVIGISRLIARIAENSREQSQRRDRQAQQSNQQRPIIAAAPKADEERVREFLDALGVPKEVTPPPKVRPRTDIPPRPLAPIPPPPLPTPFPPVTLTPLREKVRKVFTPAPKPVVTASSPSQTEEPSAWLRDEQRIESAAAKFETAIQAAPELTTAAAAPAMFNWKEALRSRESVRAALVLREILGPPKGLREVEFA
ncbi:MAG: hypothetical protein ACR2FX_04910 [Chthoniobacterales bacterium]